MSSGSYVVESKALNNLTVNVKLIFKAVLFIYKQEMNCCRTKGVRWGQDTRALHALFWQLRGKVIHHI